MNDYITKNRGVITNSKLNAFKFCQHLYKLQFIDEVVPDQTNDAMLFGSAFDLMSQSVKRFEAKYEVVTRRTKGVDNQLTKTQGENLYSSWGEAGRQPNFDTEGFIPQHEVNVRYKNIILRGTLDFYSAEQAKIVDVKTTGSIGMMERDWLEKYKRQLAFYSLLIDLSEDIECDGYIYAVTRENLPKSEFYFAHKDGLRDLRGEIIRDIDNFIEVMEGDIYASSEREKCLKCPAYGVCPYSIRKKGEFIPL